MIQLLSAQLWCSAVLPQVLSSLTRSPACRIEPHTVLENINLKKKLSREDWKRILPPLQQRLNDLEKACWDQQVPTMIVFEGWDAAGKGTTISALTQRLDPRGFKLYPIASPRTYEQQRPWLWRFWLKVPNRVRWSSSTRAGTAVSWRSAWKRQSRSRRGGRPIATSWSLSACSPTTAPPS